MTAKVGNASQFLWFGDNLMTIRVPASAENDQISIIECRMPQGESTPLHVNLRQDDIIHILEGAMCFRVDGKVFVAETGQTVVAPKGIPHTFQVESADGATCLIVTQGGDFEQLVRQMSVPVASISQPAKSDRKQESARRSLETCAKGNIQVIGAPLP